MRVLEMRELNEDDLKSRINDTRKEIVDLRFQLATRKLESPAKLRTAKKTLARLLTIQHQKSTDSAQSKAPAKEKTKTQTAKSAESTKAAKAKPPKAEKKESALPKKAPAKKAAAKKSEQ